MKFYPYEKGGGRKSSSHDEGVGGGTTSFEVGLAILMGGGGEGQRVSTL